MGLRWGQVDFTPIKPAPTSFRLRDESLEDPDNLPAPAVLAQEILDDLEAALEQFHEIANDLGRKQE